MAKRKNNIDDIDIVDDFELEDIDDFVESYRGNIYVDKSTINAYDFALIGDKAKILDDSPIKLMKSVKTDDEIAHYKDCLLYTSDAADEL